MKAKHAIGITVNGNEVRAAFLSLIHGKARIKALESVKLDAPIEGNDNSDKSSANAVNDFDSPFDVIESESDAEKRAVDSAEEIEGDKNVSKIYALLEKFKNMKANLAINAPHLTVKYDIVDKDQVPNKRKRKQDIKLEAKPGVESRGQKYLPASDDRSIMVDYDYHPPILDVLDEVNQFRSGNLNIVLMDTSELALSELVREIYKFEKTEITAIVYIEQDFSRVIFLKGRDIYHITPILHKGSVAEDVLEVLYSRIIFAQDHYFIPEISKILVAGHSSRLKAKYYFRQKFPSAIVGYLNSKKIQSDLRFKDRGMLFSRYAVPIALAWKALLKDVVKSKSSNFLPEYILDRQTLPKLAAHGYLILFLLICTVSFFTYSLVQKELELEKVNKVIHNVQMQLGNNKALTERVAAYDDEILDIERKIALVDSFSKGYDQSIQFLQILNKNIQATGDIWITSLTFSKEVVKVQGTAKKREQIPALANAIGGASLKKVTRATYQGVNVFAFHLEKRLDEDESRKNLTIFSILKNRNGTSGSGKPANIRGANGTNGR